MDKKYDLLDALSAIDPTCLTYAEWTQIGMALKHEGYSADDWDRWSARDAARYHMGDCAKKWQTFNGGSGAVVTGGTIVQMAMENGWEPAGREAHELDWDSDIGGSNDVQIVKTGWVEDVEVREPERWDPAGEIIRYLETLFEAGECVGYVTSTWEKDGKFLPSKGNYDRTAGELIQLLSKHRDDIGAVIGDVNEQAGAWIRFNPLDGKGVKNENVTDFRYGLVECDNIPVERQHALIRELELPCAMVVYSGGKSLHAIVKIDAKDYAEYRARVDYLYKVCQKNGLALDVQNKNPSRLSRMPGVMRNGKKQFIVDTNIGQTSWEEWRDWIEEINDDLPDPESLSDAWANMPDLNPVLIDGVLRQGHKMLISGPSKSGKSYLLMNLCIAIAEGRDWIGWKCAQGRVMYVNLELDRASCLHRFQDIYNALGIAPDNIGNIDVWNLRGKSAPMDKLAPKLIRRAQKKDYIAVVIDPIYKVITGDENSADQMAKFCNQFDRICTELGTAVIYCHHHSKGQQGQKRSMDRASGSGVFARDPDALLDLLELGVTDGAKLKARDMWTCTVAAEYLERYKPGYIMQHDFKEMMDPLKLTADLSGLMTPDVVAQYAKELQDGYDRLDKRTAWRIEGTLREFERFDPVNLWFDFPVHKEDLSGMLEHAYPADSEINQVSPEQREQARKDKQVAKRKQQANDLRAAVENAAMGEPPTVKELADYMQLSIRRTREIINENSGFVIDKNSHKVVPEE